MEMVTGVSGDVGVIVGRFQVPFLTDGHKDLIDSVSERHDKVIIFLGLSQVRGSARNPLDFEARKQMILDAYPDITILYIKDMMSDEVWTKKLDEQIRDMLSPKQTAVLYGSRDSFISYYEKSKGRYPTQEFIPDRIISGSEIRNAISRKVKASEEFREGVVWAASNQYPKVWQCTDVAVINYETMKILLGRKPNETQYRFIGGFTDPKDKCLELAAKRELGEEVRNIETGPMNYICSSAVDDWRYRHESDKIITVLFECNYLFGSPEPDDDIAEVRWFDLDRFNCEPDFVASAYGCLVPNHMLLMDELMTYLKTIKKIDFGPMKTEKGAE